jgi:hypothetical protein
MFSDEMRKAAAQLADPAWWAPVVRPTCAACRAPIAASQRRVVDGRSDRVRITHVGCVLRWEKVWVPAPVVERPPHGRSRAPFHQLQDAGALRAHSDELRRACAEVRARADQALEAIDALLAMLRQRHGGGLTTAQLARPSHDDERGDGGPNTSHEK